MKKFLLLSLVMFVSSNVSFAYIADSNQSYDINSGSKIGNTYYSWDNKTNSYVRYTQQNNQIYGSDGSSYTRYENTVQDNFTGKTWQINNNLAEPLY